MYILKHFIVDTFENTDNISIAGAIATSFLPISIVVKQLFNNGHINNRPVLIQILLPIYIDNYIFQNDI